MIEANIEAHLIKQCMDRGIYCRKVTWLGHRNAPDRFLAHGGKLCWVELKHPATGHLFPKDFRERAQAREHARMRAAGCDVRVIWTKQQVDELMEELCKNPT